MVTLVYVPRASNRLCSAVSEAQIQVFAPKMFPYKTVASVNIASKMQTRTCKSIVLKCILRRRCQHPIGMHKGPLNKTVLGDLKYPLGPTATKFVNSRKIVSLVASGGLDRELAFFFF